MRTDNEIRTDILRQLEWEAGVSHSEIGVSVNKGIVRLSGQVKSYYEKMVAENAARMIAGVKAIADDVQIGVVPSEDTSDVAIAEAVATALASHKFVDERKICVIVDKGVVTLEGSANWNFERKAAAEVISGLKGIRGINNYLVIKPEMPVGDIKNGIEACLGRLATVDPERISVYVSGDKVVLTGTVRSLAEGDDVVYAAWSAPGVAAVENRLVLEEVEQ